MQTEAESASKPPRASTGVSVLLPFQSKLVSVFTAERQEEEAPEAVWSLRGEIISTIKSET